jgi:hypothetical protein
MSQTKIYQIWYKEGKVPPMDFPVILNYPDGDLRYLFFESRVLQLAVIQGLHLDSTHFGLLSPNYLQKIENCKYWGEDVANTSKNVITSKESILEFIDENKQYDVIGLSSHPPHLACCFAEYYHHNFCRIMQMVLDAIGYDVNINEKNERIIYFNYFVAKPEILEQFVSELLSPFIAACYDNERLRSLVFTKNSNYAKPFPDNLAKMYGIDFYCYAPFLAERLIILFLHKHRNITFTSL